MPATLSRTFLEPYYAARDPFDSLLARTTYLSKYQRPGENWTDTIRRVVEGNVALDKGVETREAEELFDAIWHMRALPAGRSLWAGGIEGMNPRALFNCFRGDTKFFADGTVKTFAETVGTTVKVSCADGWCRPAEVKSFGVQRLFKATFVAAGGGWAPIDVHVTRDHRWLTINRGEVTDLRVGDMVAMAQTPIVHRESKEFRDGFAHGVVFGDGSVRPPTHLQDGTKAFRLRLIGRKETLLDELKLAPTFGGVVGTMVDYDTFASLKSKIDLRELPPSDACYAYQAGFLAGWLALRGHRPAEDPTSVFLDRVEAAAIEWATDRAWLLGLMPVGRAVFSSNDLGLGTGTPTIHRVALTNAIGEFEVLAFDDTGESEEVFCVVEPETHTFVLSAGIVTSNCWGKALRSTDDWGWIMDQLMLGGGVGVSLLEADLGVVARGYPSFVLEHAPSHPDKTETLAALQKVRESTDAAQIYAITPAKVGRDAPFHSIEAVDIGDTREGWVDSLRRVCRAAFNGHSVLVRYHRVRPKGRPIRTFGGTAAGPAPLVGLLATAYQIIRGAAGRKLTSVEMLDITTNIGVCVKAGNVRRSALLVLGHAHDEEFRNAKRDYEAILRNRHSSNNSVAILSEAEADAFDWDRIAHDNLEFGDPGINALWLVRKLQRNQSLVTSNPCGEQFLEDAESCNLASVYPTRHRSWLDAERSFELIARYAYRQRLPAFEDDPAADAVRHRNMRIGISIGGVVDAMARAKRTGVSMKALYRRWYYAVRETADAYASALGKPLPATVTTEQPEGTKSLLPSSLKFGAVAFGEHAHPSEFWVRRNRVPAGRPLALALIEAGVPYVPAPESPGDLAFEFPQRAPEGALTDGEQSVVDQVYRVRELQDHYVDNAVSSTISYDAGNPRELADALKAHGKWLRSASFMSRSHGYEAAPIEPISREEFEARVKSIRHDHPLSGIVIHDSDFSGAECAGGACPIR